MKLGYFILTRLLRTAWPRLRLRLGSGTHTLGLGLLVGRVSHAFGVSREPENYRFRVVGMALTPGVLIAASVSLLVSALRAN